MPFTAATPISVRAFCELFLALDALDFGFEVFVILEQPSVLLA
jgi:hypothetical protein